MTLSTSYAFGDVFGAHHSLHRGWRDAKFFYGAFTAMVVVAAGIVLIPGAPLGLITTGVQALAGVLLPSATVFLLLLCNDKQVLGPWVNRLWLNIVSSVIVSILLVMSLVLMITTLFTTVDVTVLAEVLGAVLGVSYVGGGAAAGQEPLPPRAAAGRADGAPGHLAHAPAEPAGAPDLVEDPPDRHVGPAHLPGGRRPAPASSRPSSSDSTTGG